MRCGQCLQVFDALETLSDGNVSVTGVPAVGAAALGLDTVAQPPLAAGVLLPTAAGEVGLGDAVGRIVPGEQDELATAGIDTAPLSPDAGRWPARNVDPPFDVGALPPAAAQAEPAPAARAADADADVPEILREDIASQARRRRQRRAALGFGLGSLLMAAVLLLQFAWFKPRELLGRYPQGRPWLELLCERSGCVLPDRRDPARVRMTARDVRMHPRYEGALRVNASLINTAPYAQPYPRLNFTLFNVNGQIIASRVFAPAEYLPAGIDPAGDMLPRQPVQIALDLLAPEDAAVSFEFGFL